MKLIKSLISEAIKLLVSISELFVKLHRQFLDLLLVCLAVVHNSLNLSIGLFGFLLLFLGLGLEVFLDCAHLGDNFVSELGNELGHLLDISLAN